MSLLERIIEVMSENRKVANVNEIAEMLCDNYSEYSLNDTTFIQKISNTLSTDIRKNGRNSHFSKQKNNRGGHLRGTYK